MADSIGLPQASWYLPIKTVLEFLAAVILFLLAAPVMLVAAVLVKLTSPGPVLYSQTRLGRHGRPYRIYKLRTMRHNCEKVSGPCWSTANDPRVTPIGYFLRRSHLDELPQLWNVLRGEMSLIGPRPERPEFVPQLIEAIPLYGCRLLIRPGVTGLAQVQLPADTDLASVRRKLAYDLYYVRHSSPWLDFKLLLATALHVLHVPYVRIGQLLRLPRCKPIERAYQALASGRRESPALSSAGDDEPAGVIEVEMVTC